METEISEDSKNSQDSGENEKTGQENKSNKAVKEIELKPRVYIPTLYFAEGLPFTIVNQMSVVFYKNLEASNSFIGAVTSFLYLPWTIKFLWSPLVDVYETKKKWIVVIQFILAGFTLLLAGSVFLPDALFFSALIFIAIGVSSATHDIAIDGYYMDALDLDQQALYVGVRNAFYKVAWLLGSGALVFLAGILSENSAFGVRGGWCVSFLVCSLLLCALAAFHAIALPQTEARKKVPSKSPIEVENTAPRKKITPGEFLRVFRTWVDQPGIIAIIAYILIFRAGDALMLKMAQPFLLDTKSKGGMAIATSDVGLIYGTVGVIFLLAGGLFGGWLISRFGLWRCLLPTALVQNGAILLYWWLARAKPEGDARIMGLDITSAASCISSSEGFLRWFEGSLFFSILINSAEQFAYGLGTAAYTVFLLRTVKSEYKAAHYAIATAIMALGVMIPGSVSGVLADSYGYERFFLLSFLVSIPGMIVIFWLPLRAKKPLA